MVVIPERYSNERDSSLLFVDDRLCNFHFYFFPNENRFELFETNVFTPCIFQKIACNDKMPLVHQHCVRSGPIIRFLDSSF